MSSNIKITPKEPFSYTAPKPCKSGSSPATDFLLYPIEEGNEDQELAFTPTERSFLKGDSSSLPLIAPVQQIAEKNFPSPLAISSFNISSEGSFFKTTAFDGLMGLKKYPAISILFEVEILSEGEKRLFNEDLFTCLPESEITPIQLVRPSHLTKILKGLSYPLLYQLNLHLRQSQSINLSELSKKQLYWFLCNMLDKTKNHLSKEQLLFCCRENFFLKGTYLQKYSSSQELATLTEAEKKELLSQEFNLGKFNKSMAKNLDKHVWGFPLFSKERGPREISQNIRRERTHATLEDLNLIEPLRRLVTHTIEYVTEKDSLDEIELTVLFFFLPEGNNLPLVTSLPDCLVQKIQNTLAKSTKDLIIYQSLLSLTNTQFQAIDLSQIEQNPSDIKEGRLDYFLLFRNIAKQPISLILDYDLNPEIAYDLGVDQKSLSAAQIQFFMLSGDLSEESLKFYTTPQIIQEYHEKYGGNSL